MKLLNLPLRTCQIVTHLPGSEFSFPRRYHHEFLRGDNRFWGGPPLGLKCVLTYHQKRSCQVDAYELDTHVNGHTEGRGRSHDGGDVPYESQQRFGSNLKATRLNIVNTEYPLDCELTQSVIMQVITENRHMMMKVDPKNGMTVLVFFSSS
jgi:hypothetical protein